MIKGDLMGKKESPTDTISKKKGMFWYSFFYRVKI
jgi:hypothetical protein